MGLPCAFSFSKALSIFFLVCFIFNIRCTRFFNSRSKLVLYKNSNSCRLVLTRPAFDFSVFYVILLPAVVALWLWHSATKLESAGSNSSRGCHISMTMKCTNAHVLDIGATRKPRWWKLSKILTTVCLMIKLLFCHVKTQNLIVLCHLAFLFYLALRILQRTFTHNVIRPFVSLSTILPLKPENSKIWWHLLEIVFCTRGTLIYNRKNHDWLWARV